MRVLIVAQLLELTAAASLRLNAAPFPPDSCSCACCTVQPDNSCNMPGPQHWKHQACTYGLCGNAHIRGKKGNLYVQKKKKEFCLAHCHAPSGAAQGDSCECNNGNADNWACP